MGSRRSRTRRASPRISSASSSRASSSRTAARFRTTTSRRSRRSTSCSACAAACRSSSRPSRARPSRSTSSLRHDRQREAEDPGQGGHPAGSAAPHLRGQAARGRPHAFGLQHPEGVDAPPRAPPARRLLNLKRVGVIRAFFNGPLPALLRVPRAGGAKRDRASKRKKKKKKKKKKIFFAFLPFL